MKDSIKAIALCVLAFLLGCVVVMSMGCAVGAGVRVHGYGAEVGATTTLEVEACECCGFVPWTDSWCEYHMGA